MEEYFVAATYIAVTQLNLSRRIVPENKEYYGVPPASTVAGEYRKIVLLLKRVSLQKYFLTKIMANIMPYKLKKSSKVKFQI